MGDLHGDPVLSPLRHLFFFWGGGLSPLRCLFSKNLPLGGLYGGTRFFSAFNAVLFCTFVVWRAGRAYVFCCVWALGAGLSLPSVGFVNAV